jgi:nucleotide-binding universal stress UspA family protein
MLDGAPCAVAVAPRGFAQNGPLDGRPIGVAYDGGAESERALAAAERLAAPLGTSLLLIGIVREITPIGTDAPEELQEVRRPLVEDCWSDLAAARHEIAGDVNCEISVLEGEPADLLIARSRDLGVLVLGSRGYGPLRATLLGGVSRRVMNGAQCPVVVVPRGSVKTGDRGLVSPEALLAIA